MERADTGSFIVGLKPPSDEPKTWAQTQRDTAALDLIRIVVADYLEPSNMDPDRHFDAMNKIIAIIEIKTGYRFLEIVPEPPDDGGPAS